MSLTNQEEPTEPLPLVSLSTILKKYATFQKYDSDPYKNTKATNRKPSSKSPKLHCRRASAPSIATMQHLQDSDTEIETDKYEDYIIEHCPQLILDCECKSCHPPSILSPPTSPYNIPFSSMQHATSAPQFVSPSPSKSSTPRPPTFTDPRYSVAASCQQTKNLSLIRTIGIGVKNNMPRLLSILNDINNRLLFQQYQDDEDDDNKLEDEDDDDDDDVDIIEFESVHAAFTNFSRLNSLSPITSSKSCFSLDCVPLLSNKNIVRFNNSWNILNKMPIHQALRTYQERIAKPLTFSPKYLIKDSMVHYIGQISLITAVVQKLVQNHSMPLQLDCVILSKQAVENKDCNDIDIQTVESKADDGNDNEKEEKDELIKPCSANKLSQHKYHHYDDDIGNNLMDRFQALPEKHGDHYSKFAVGVPPKGRARDKLGAILQKRVKLLKKTQHGRYVVIIDREGQRTNALYKETWKKQKEEKTQPSLKRKTTTKILLLDKKPKRTKREDKKSEEDENKKSEEDFFYTFQPPKPFGDIIEGIAMSESMHMNTLDFLIPALKSEDCPIGARHLCGGKMFCISFHMMSKDEVKCYLYVDQKCMKIELKRNKPITDLMKILPHYFEDNIVKTLQINTLNDSETKEFKKCIDSNKFSHQDIENDIGLEYKKSKIVKFLRTMPYSWKETRIQTLYDSLRALFGSNNVENTAKFSTIDTEYNEMVKKLGIEKKI